MEPRLVRAMYRDDRRYQVAPKVLRRTVSADTAAALTTIMEGVVTDGTAKRAQIPGYTIAGKTGTAQNSENPNADHAWFVGFAPADDPQIVVAVMLEFGGHGSRAARVASKIIEHYLKTTPTQLINTEGE